MALQTFVGSLAQPGATGNQSTTAPGFKPKVVIFWGNVQTADGSAANTNFWFAAATSSTDRRGMSHESTNNVATSATALAYTSATCIRIINAAATVVAAADFVSMDTNGFTINWSTVDATARIVNYIALGGTDLTNAVTGSGTEIVTGNQAYTGVGFKPDCLIMFIPRDETFDPALETASLTGSIGFLTPGGEGFSGFRNRNGANPSVAHRQQLTSAGYAVTGDTDPDTQATLVSMDTDGFTLSWSNGSAGGFFYYVALKGGQYKVGVDTQKTSTGTKATTGVGFQPTGLFIQSICEAASTTTDANQRHSFGAASGTANRAATWYGATHNVSPTVCSQNLDRTKIVKMMTEAGASPTTQAAADLSSFDSGGFTLNWTTADATARQFLYLAFGSNAATTAVKMQAVRGWSWAI